MGRVAAIAGPLPEPGYQIDPPVRLKPELAASTRPTAGRSAILPKGNPGSATLLIESDDGRRTARPYHKPRHVITTT